MALRKIVTYPNPILRKKTSPVTKFDDSLQELVADMAETMYKAPGVGLAANQIGVDLQVVVIDITPSEQPEKNLMVLINPEIVASEGEQVEEEGCLSVLSYSANVKRFKKISVKAKDIESNPLEFDAEDFLARVIQHELDHLRGKLFIDRISALKRALYKKKLKKILKERDEAKAE